MKSKLLLAVTGITLLAFPKTNFGQALELGTASGFALFTTVGAIANTGTTAITGDVGTNVGSFTGFPPGTMAGQLYVADTATTQAVTDVNSAYNCLSGLACG